MHYEGLETIALAVLAIERLISAISNERKKRLSNSKNNSKKAKIYNIIKELSTDTGADHVLRFMFHNGGKLATGESMDKVTILEDAHHPSISSISHFFQNVPFERVPILVSKLSTNGVVEYTYDSVEDSYLKQFFGLTDIKTFYAISIIKRNKIVGFLAATTNRDGKELTLQDQQRITTTVTDIKRLI